MDEQNKTKTTWWERNKKKVLSVGGVVLLAGIGIGVTVFVLKGKKVPPTVIKKGGTIVQNVSSVSEEVIAEGVSEIAPIISSESSCTHLPINNGDPFEVKGFIRNLPKGYHPSSEKIAQAVEMGIELGENQTIVNSFIKNVA